MIWHNVKKWLRGGCVWYAVISLAMLLLERMIGPANYAVNATAFLLMFPCGLSISAGGMLLKYDRLPRWIRYLSHYMITLLAFVLFLWLPSGANPSPVTVLIVLFALTLLYWLGFLLIHIFQKRWKKLLAED